MKEASPSELQSGGTGGVKTYVVHFLLANLTLLALHAYPVVVPDDIAHMFYLEAAGMACIIRGQTQPYEGRK